ncbi:SulP family inorganic anion transporter [Umezawaea tangerina]|uniref:carbonic anhydrase n=1 Tax=Umezawaea tangerina TaxID=84725 RepID=A0A2T0SZK9_9PSEU|nr:SulP family inorganic anion transporter [Umezawaea tangerina]PRY38855.1 carbonic anhydrase [Umezawaea tangerina]
MDPRDVPSTVQHTRRAAVRRWARRDLRYDLSASLVVFLVAMPLSLGIAVASDAPITAGLIAAVVGGVVAGLLGGAPLQVSGPAAGLTLVVAGFVAQFGWAVTCAITVAAGVLQVGLGVSRVARAALAISPAVVHGMLAGIGVTIALAQLHVLLGGEPGTGAWENLTQLPAQLLGVHTGEAVVGLVVLGVLLLWPVMPAAVRGVPASLVGVVGATLLAGVLSWDVDRVELPGSLLDSVRLPELPDGRWGAVALAVFTMTVIASVESLLSAVAVDKLKDRGRSADLDRELVGQGAANAVSGLLGGLPVTGVIVRSSTNVAAGARTRASAVLHGVWVLLFSLLLVGLIEQVPMAALAGLLVYVGFKLLKLQDVRTALRQSELPVYVTTVTCVVFLDLLMGVLIGFALSVAVMLRRVVWAKLRVSRTPVPGGPDHWTVVVEGTLSFLSIPRLSRVLSHVPDGAPVDVELAVDFLDHATYEHLVMWRDQHEKTGGVVHVDEVSGIRGGMSRRGAGAVLPRWFAPWSSWQTSVPAQRHSDHDEAARPLVSGVQEYHRRSAPLLRPVFEGLSDGQEPQAMFLTCADSRIVPNVITSSGPGDLFTVRNVGNLAPCDDDGVGASVHYAVDVLRVSALVVCGHSGCGGMRALLDGDAGSDGPVGRWLHSGVGSLHALRAGHPADPGTGSEVDRLAMVNVAVQVASLERMPVVRDAVAEGRLKVIGMFFDIGAARLSLLTDDRTAFSALPEGVDVLG